jgi:hypothetical protein
MQLKYWVGAGGLLTAFVCSACLAGVALAMAPGTAADNAPAIPVLFYSKSFPGSLPEYAEVRLDASGAAEYREAADEELPLKFRLTPDETQTIFTLAAKLDHFRRPVESGLKVAFTGKKVFRYVNGDQKQEVLFNYTEDPDAQLLLSWFERIAATERIYIELERAAKFDKLGVNRVLLHLQSLTDRDHVVAPEQFLPLLDRIIKNASYVNMARTRAANLAAVYRARSSDSPR